MIPPQNRNGDISPQSTNPPLGAPFGPYLLTRKIAHGGMAEIFLGVSQEGESESLPRIIKCILPNLAGDPQFFAMFINEAQLAAQMRHPNIVQVLDFGEYQGRLYMAMEYIDGLDCWRFARQLHPWGKDHTALAVWIICCVLDALEYAHGMTDVNGHPLNVVHRDLSPSNIYLSLTGEVKLGDFGIAQIQSGRYRQVTMIPKGKFGYMAPEQVEGLPSDRRADIFAVGVVLAELLIGKKMFSGPSQLSVMLEIKDARLDTLRQNVDRVEPGLLDILHRALARKPADRFSSAKEFQQALQDYIGRQNRTSSGEDLAAQLRQAVNRKEKTSSMPAGVEPQTPITKEVTPQEEITAQARDFGADTIQGKASYPLQDLIDEDDFPEDGTPITRDDSPFENECRYIAILVDGRKVGPTSFAHIIELICSDEIGSETLISMDGSAFTAAATRPELARHLPVYTPTCDVDELDTPERKGVLQLEAASEVILSLAIKLETGMLVCKRDSWRKEVYFEKGQPKYVGSNDPSELLGEYLVSKEAIERPELELALALLPKFNGHMGDTMIALGMLSAVELFNHISAQITCRFQELIGWQYGRYEFYRGTSCRSDVLEVAVDPFATISECLLARCEEIEILTSLASMKDSIISFTPVASELITRLTLPPEIRSVLREVTAPVSLGELAASRRGPEAERSLAQAFFIAVETGLWSIEGPTLPWRNQNDDYDITP